MAPAVHTEATALSSCVSPSDTQTHIKTELREFLAKKRRDDGMGPYSSHNLWENSPKYEMTEEEQRRIDHRRERNRAAARKSRERRRSELERLKQITIVLQTQKENLTRELKQLRDQIDSLALLVSKHAQRCSSLREETASMYQ